VSRTDEAHEHNKRSLRFRVGSRPGLRKQYANSRLNLVVILPSLALGLPWYRSHELEHAVPEWALHLWPPKVNQDVGPLLQSERKNARTVSNPRPLSHDPLARRWFSLDVSLQPVIIHSRKTRCRHPLRSPGISLTLKLTSLQDPSTRHDPPPSPAAPAVRTTARSGGLGAPLSPDLPCLSGTTGCISFGPHSVSVVVVVVVGAPLSLSLLRDNNDP
jgi:hypothetical protein